MTPACCYNCVYSCCDPQTWLRSLCAGESLVPRCANHPWWPGQMHDVPGTACRNYRSRPVLPEGDTVRLIPLGDGYYAYVDAADYEWLSRYNWRLQNGYAARREKGKVVLMHRELTQAPRGMVVDHIDANKTNNCRFNLRVCTYAENLCNARKHCDARSRFKGVSYHRKWGKWCARCKYKGRQRSFGYYEIEVEAARAYDRGAVECFGEFARVNFPEEWPPERRAEVYAQRDAAKTEGKRVRRSEGQNGGQTKGRRTRPGATAAARENKRRKATARRPSVIPQATNSERRATKPGKTSARKTQPARRTTNPRRATDCRSATQDKTMRKEHSTRRGSAQRANCKSQIANTKGSHAKPSRRRDRKRTTDKKGSTRNGKNARRRARRQS